MPRITVTPLSDDLPFGARIGGINPENVHDEAIRRQINDVFIDRGMIVFEDVEPNGRMQVALSEVFGSLQETARSFAASSPGTSTPATPTS
jgi:taurine dioxygenase